MSAPPPATASWDGPADLPLPERFGRYRVVRRLGAGGMGAVFLADDPDLRRTVAVKVPHLGPAADPTQAIARFLREARAAAAVLHPNVCPVFDAGVQDGVPFAVMAYIPGGSLADWLRAGRVEDVVAAADLAAQVADGLAAVHARGLVHRDLKPGNILLDAGVAKITDFGLARPADDGDPLTQPGGLAGTPAYMAPEQAAGETDHIGPASDVYALGVVLYQLLTGRLPFEGPALVVLAKVRDQVPTPPETLRPDLPPELTAVVAKAMARRPEDRYPSAAACGADLRRWLAGRPPGRPGGPAVVKLETPGGDPVTVSVDTGGRPAGTVTVSMSERRSKKKGRVLTVVVRLTVAVAVVAAVGLAAVAPFVTNSRHESSVAMNPHPVPPTKTGDDTPPVVPPLVRVREPRVRIAYDQEAMGAEKSQELPFVIGVLADLGSHSPRPARPLRDRRFVTVDRDNIDGVLEGVEPRLTLPGVDPGGGPDPVVLAFHRLADFEPAAVARRVPALKAMLDTRPGLERGEATADLDRRVSGKLAQILHHPEFRRLEATWRGLSYLVSNAETSQLLKVKVLNATKTELAKDLERAVEADQSQVFKKVVTEEFGVLGGQPFGLLVGDFAVDVTVPADVEFLARLSEVAAAAQAPVVAAAAPGGFGMTDFAELPRPRDLAKVFAGIDHKAWLAFRDKSESRYVALALPRVLARLPYTFRGNADGFSFEEPDAPASPRVWMNPGWVYAGVVADAVAKYGWPARTCGRDGGGRVEGLPATPIPTAEGDTAPLGPVEVPVTLAREQELAALGFLGLLPTRGPVPAVFPSAASCRRDRDDPAARLNVLLCATRVAQTLMVLTRERIGFGTDKELEDGLNRWLAGYVLADPAAAAADRAKRPLAGAGVKLRRLAGPAFDALELTVTLRPAYQLDPAAAAVTLTARVAVPKAGDR